MHHGRVEFVVVVVVVASFFTLSVFLLVLVVARPQLTQHRWATDRGRSTAVCCCCVCFCFLVCFLFGSRGSKISLVYIPPVGNGRTEGGPRQFDRGCRRNSITFDKNIENTLRASDCLFLLESNGIGVLEFVRCSPDDLWKTPLFMERLGFKIYFNL